MRLILSLLAATFVASTPAQAQKAKTNKPAESCKLMMGKLAVQYEIATLAARNAKRKGESAKLDESAASMAESLTSKAYGTRRSDLKKGEERFYDFSVVQLEVALERLVEPELFREVSTSQCLNEFAG